MPHPQRLAAAALAALILGGLVWTGLRWRASAAEGRLPAPPQVSMRPAIREHLGQAYAVARQAPTSLVAVGALCRAYHADMFFDQAEPCYEIAAGLAPGEWRWIYDRAIIQSERGGGAPLAANLRRVVEMAPDFGPAWLRLGEAEFKAGRYDEASAAWQRARNSPAQPPPGASPPHVIEVPLSAYASLGLARVAMARDELDSARKILEDVVTVTPRFGPALRLLAESYRRLGREAEAETLVYRAGRLPPYAPYADPVIDELARESRNSTLLMRLASEASLATNAPWAEHLTRRALEFDPTNPDVVVKMGRILRTVERNDEALVYFQRYHEMVPGDVQGLAHIGGCLSALGRYDEAEGYLRRALAGIDDPVSHYNLGLLLSLTGRVDEAIVEYERAIARDQGHSGARMNLAAALARNGQLDRASRELTRLVEDDPENAPARTSLGLLLIQRGEAVRARVQLTEALRIDPAFGPASEALATLGR